MWGELFKGAVDIGLNMYAANQQNQAAQAAAGQIGQGNAMSAAQYQNAIAEQRRQFDAVQKLLAPFTTGGTQAFLAQQALAGLGGEAAQKKAIGQITNSAAYKSAISEAEQAMLANASATGGLRGGNTQAALQRIRPAIQQQMITDQFNRLGALAGGGLSAATQTGTAGMQTGSNIGNLMTGIGGLNQNTAQAMAAQALAQGQGNLMLANTAGNVLGGLAGRLF